jgi:DNA invertase Pin-like site-specific DNA recombinase
MKKKRAALYVRVSTDEQNTDAQERVLKEYVQRRGWLLHHTYKDTGISGTASSRPGLNELMKDCRRRAIDVVVVEI